MTIMKNIIKYTLISFIILSVLTILFVIYYSIWNDYTSFIQNLLTTAAITLLLNMLIYLILHESYNYFKK